MDQLMNHTSYDIIIIGTGAGGGTLAHELAHTGKRILILERGDFLPQVYGAALIRMRERDFEAVEHKGGISPAWPLSYTDFEPYYTRAERLYHVHGQRGEDPTEPPSSEPYPCPPVRHEHCMQITRDCLEQQGFYPFHLPLALRLNEVDRTFSDCIRCDTCDGYPCLVNGKADADINGVRPVRDRSNVTLITRAKVNRLYTSESGREVTAVEAEIDGEPRQFRGDIVVVACGAINSAGLLLRSRNDAHPHGLANSSDQLGRNWIFEVSHWFDQCDLKSFERSGSKVSPTVTPPCRTIGERKCRICIKACHTPSGIANIMLCLCRNIERKRYLGRFGSI